MAEELKVYTDDEVKARLERELPKWYLDGKRICRQYKTDGWQSTLMLVNAVAFICEAAWHHPDLEVSWAKVLVKLNTHSANGITDRDFELARKIEETGTWRPPQGSALEGTPNKWVR